MKSRNTGVTSLSEYRSCQRCKLAECRSRVVLGSGNLRAKVFVVVDSPSEAEDRAGHYNTADIRWLINLFKQALRLNMPLGAAAEKFFSEAFITSAVMCRPAITVGDKAGERRDPKWAEIKACRERLQQQIYESDPYVILGRGKFPLSALFGVASPPSAKTGKLNEMPTITVPGEFSDVPYSVIPAPDPQVARRRGDYDDPNGVVAALGNALGAAWAIRDALEGEDK